MTEKKTKKQSKKKGLLSILALIICVSMFAAGTYAWFTDTATVGGNRVMAGNLAVDIVMTKDEIDARGNAPSGFADAETVTDAVNALQGDTSPYNGAKAVNPSGTLDGNTKFIVTDTKAGIIQLGNLEPGQVHPVVMTVKNSGELAIGFTAGFKLPKRTTVETGKSEYTSYTGLETLEMQKDGGGLKLHWAAGSTLGEGNVGGLPDKVEEYLTEEEYKFMLGKLLPKQYKKDPKSVAYTSAYAGKSEYDKGGYLEDVLEVYALSSKDYNDYYVSGSWKPEATKDLTGNNADGTKNERYLGTISNLIHYNDDTYKTNLDQKIKELSDKLDDTSLTTAERAALELELQAKTDEKAALATTKDKLATVSSGYCVPTKALGSSLSIPVTLKQDGMQEMTIEDVSDYGTAVYLLKLSEDADDTYQNAYIELDMGVTANQVRWDTDGLNNYLYDPTPELTPIS